MVVAVTGSSRGIGRETARLLLGAGAAVVLNGRNAERLEATVAELNDSVPNARCSAVAGDVADESGAQALVDHAVERWGRLDALINNAGVSMRGAVGELRAATVDHLSAVNLRGAVLPTVAALPHLRSRGGAVVFVSTVAALHGFPGVSLYSATKAAVGTFADALAAEEPQLSVSTVFLGFVENDADKTTLGADGQAFHHERKAMQTQQAAAEAILHALARRRRRSITVVPGRFLDLAVRLAPGLVTRLLAHSSGKVHGVTRRD